MSGWAYDQVGDEDLQNLGPQARPAGEQLLEDRDHDVAQRCADEGTVDGHLGHATGEVVAVLAAILCDPRSEKLLRARKGSRGDHLGLQRVILELLQIPLSRVLARLLFCPRHVSVSAHSKISVGARAFREGIANLVGHIFLARRW